MVAGLLVPDEQESTELESFSFASLPFAEKLDRFARLAVRIGLNLQPGQELLVTATTDMLPLLRLVTKHAYLAGAKLVTTFVTDDEVVLARYLYGGTDAFDHAAVWMAEGIEKAFRSGAARLALTGVDPALLAGQDPAKIARVNVASSTANKPAMDLLTRHAVNWSIVASATPAWARCVFPGLPDDEAVERLWDAIFTASRVTDEDPIETWRRHSADLHRRVNYLNAKRFHALHFFSTDRTTDLTVGLADQHVWAGGGAKAGNGVFSNANIPTEECFTAPHRERVNGVVRASKPLSNQGTLIENISCRFENGRLVEASATTGNDALTRLISTDEGARHLGEVALVPHSSPIAQSGILFWNTLFDENAASHIALGQAYATCVMDGEHKNAEELAALGANSSLIHVDWMIGSADMNVDGLDEAGRAEPLMRFGDWV